MYGWACERLYHELASSYDRVSWLVSLGRWPTWRRAALAQLPVTLQPSAANLHILEIGFGTGALLLEMAQRGLTTFGLERSPAMHAVTQRKLQRHAIQIPCICGDAQHLPLANQAFDAVIATFPAPYIVATQTLHEAARVLRPGGRLIIVGLWVTINQPWLARWLPFFYGAPATDRLAAYQERITASGFQVTWLTYPDGRFAVGGLVAERSSSESLSSI